MTEKQKIYLLLDQVLLEYKLYYEEQSEKKFINDLKEYLPDLYRTSQITLITAQEINKINQWLLENGLKKFVYNVSATVA